MLSQKRKREVTNQLEQLSLVRKPQAKGQLTYSFKAGFSGLSLSCRTLLASCLLVNANLGFLPMYALSCPHCLPYCSGWTTALAELPPDTSILSLLSASCLIGADCLFLLVLGLHFWLTGLLVCPTTWLSDYYDYSAWLSDYLTSGFLSVLLTPLLLTWKLDSSLIRLTAYHLLLW